MATPTQRTVELAEIVARGFAAQEATLVEHSQEIRRVHLRMDRLEAMIGAVQKTQEEHGRILRVLLERTGP